MPYASNLLAKKPSSAECETHQRKDYHEVFHVRKGRALYYRCQLGMVLPPVPLPL